MDCFLFFIHVALGANGIASSQRIGVQVKRGILHYDFTNNGFAGEDAEKTYAGIEVFCFEEIAVVLVPHGVAYDHVVQLNGYVGKTAHHMHINITYIDLAMYLFTDLAPDLADQSFFIEMNVAPQNTPEEYKYREQDNNAPENVAVGFFQRR
jgi:hypothetical protein